MSTDRNPFQQIAAGTLYELCEKIVKSCHGMDACASGIRLHHVPGEDDSFVLYFGAPEAPADRETYFRIDRDGVWLDCEVLGQPQTDAIHIILARHFGYTEKSIAELVTLHEEHRLKMRIAEEAELTEEQHEEAYREATMRALIIEDYLLI